MADGSIGAGGRTYSAYVRWPGRANCSVPSVSPIRSTVQSPLYRFSKQELNKNTKVGWEEWISCHVQYATNTIDRAFFDGKRKNAENRSEFALAYNKEAHQAGGLRVCEHYTWQRAGSAFGLTVILQGEKCCGSGGPLYRCGGKRYIGEQTIGYSRLSRRFLPDVFIVAQCISQSHLMSTPTIAHTYKTLY